MFHDCLDRCPSLYYLTPPFLPLRFYYSFPFLSFLSTIPILPFSSSFSSSIYDFSLLFSFISSSPLPAFRPFLSSLLCLFPSSLPLSLSFSPSFFICRSEIHVIREKSAIEASFLALQPSFATVATLVSVATIVMRGHVLTVQDAFTIYTLMSVMRKATLDDFADAVRFWADSSVTLDRVENLLLDFSEDEHGGMLLSSKKGLCARVGNKFVDLKTSSIPIYVRSLPALPPSFRPSLPFSFYP